MASQGRQAALLVGTSLILRAVALDDAGANSGLQTVGSWQLEITWVDFVGFIFFSWAILSIFQAQLKTWIENPKHATSIICVLWITAIIEARELPRQFQTFFGWRYDDPRIYFDAS